MDLLVFIGIVGCLVLVVGWYALNAGAAAEGEKGLFAFRTPAQDEAAPSYREKPRRKTGVALRPQASADSAFRRAVRGFRARDDSAFRATGPLPRPADPDRTPDK